MLPLAFLTLDDRSAYVIDDDLVLAEFARQGIAVEEIPWRRQGVDWTAYRAVIIRTPWDYQRDLELFLDCLERIEAAGVPLANELSLVRWNARKTYLRDLAGRGVPIVPTQWGLGLTELQLRGLPAGLSVAECVLKPVVSANADDTYRVTADMAADQAAEIVARFQDRDWMAQPFVGSIVTEGEYSVLYFDGTLSHALRKVPKAGDFRVQEEHGGLISPLVPDAALLATADTVVAALDPAPLQARVDLVRLADGSLALMELEVIEPSLYFRMHPEASARFVAATMAWVRRHAVRVTE